MVARSPAPIEVETTLLSGDCLEGYFDTIEALELTLRRVRRHERDDGGARRKADDGADSGALPICVKIGRHRQRAERRAINLEKAVERAKVKTRGFTPSIPTKG